MTRWFAYSVVAHLEGDCSQRALNQCWIGMNEFFCGVRCEFEQVFAPDALRRFVLIVDVDEHRRHNRLIAQVEKEMANDSAGWLWQMIQLKTGSAVSGFFSRELKVEGDGSVI
jgi:hypothetical protein